MGTYVYRGTHGDMCVPPRGTHGDMCVQGGHMGTCVYRGDTWGHVCIPLGGHMGTCVYRGDTWGHVCRYVCVQVHAYIRACVCARVRTYTYVRTYIHTYIIHTHTSQFLDVDRPSAEDTTCRYASLHNHSPHRRSLFVAEEVLLVSQLLTMDCRPSKNCISTSTPPMLRFTDSRCCDAVLR